MVAEIYEAMLSLHADISEICPEVRIQRSVSLIATAALSNYKITKLARHTYFHAANYDR